MQNARRNVFLLACCQALLLANGVTNIAVTALAGYALAENKFLATLPVTIYVLGGWMAAFPASILMKRLGRRNGLLIGAAIGLAGSIIATAAIAIASFSLLAAGTLLLGMYNAFGQFYRFAAADAAPADFKAKAISLVLAGGLVGGIVGPELSKFTIDLAEPRFMASYASMAVYALMAMAVIAFLVIPNPKDDAAQGPARPLGEIARQPVFIVAATCAALGYATMTLLMTATPLAMAFCGHPYNASATVIASHVVGMFAPSFFTGSLIQRFGVLNVILVGIVIEAACVVVAISGQAIPHFWWALVLLGIGWNFTYIGGTTLLTEAYRPAEKAKVQGLNELLVFSAQAIASLSSGVLVNTTGWTKLNYFAIPVLAIAAIAAAWLAHRRRAAAAAS